MAKKINKNEDVALESILWNCRVALRGFGSTERNRDAVIGLVFLKFAGDKFEYRREEIIQEHPDILMLTELPASYNAKNIYYLKETARWSYIVENASSNDIAIIIDTAMKDIEEDNPSLNGTLPQNLYATLGAPAGKIKSLIDEINKIDEDRFHEEDLIGRVYEYFLQIYSASGTKEDGEFYTPASIVKLIAELIEPYDGVVYEMIIPKLIQFNDFRKLLLKGVQILLRGCIMKSDHWLQLNYKHGKSIWASDIVHYYYWYDDENKPVGISLNFEYADDFHYDIAMEEWGKAARLLSINEDLNNTEECLKTFFSGHSRMFDFEEFLQSNEIKFSKIALY